MSDWKDWPEDAKTGDEFLKELIKRFPDKVIVAPIEKILENFEEFFPPNGPKPNK